MLGFLLFFGIGWLFGHFLVKAFDNGIFWGLGALALLGLFMIAAELGLIFVCSFIIGIVLATFICEYLFP